MMPFDLTYSIRSVSVTKGSCMGIKCTQIAPILPILKKPLHPDTQTYTPLYVNRFDRNRLLPRNYKFCIPQQLTSFCLEKLMNFIILGPPSMFVNIFLPLKRMFYFRYYLQEHMVLTAGAIYQTKLTSPPCQYCIAPICHKQ